MKEFEAIIKIVGGLVTIFGFLAMVVKPIRKKLLDIITNTSKTKETDESLRRIEDLLVTLAEDNKNKSEEIAKITDAMKCMLRNEITNIYFKYVDHDTLPYYVRENLSKLYEEYTIFKGNSYICQCFEELMEKEVKL